MKRFHVLKIACIAFVVFAVTATFSPAQTLTTLHSFNTPDGTGLMGGLVLGYDGNFYGTTAFGGTYNYGTIFQVTSAGTFTVLHTFTGIDGSNPYAGLVQASDGNLYGTTYSGGASNYGTAFKVTTGGVFTTLHSFNATDGSYPRVGLVQATDLNLYGTTYEGGVYGWGTIFKITTAGALTTLHSFNQTDGSYPEAGLVEAIDGNLYGEASAGGGYGYGTVFKVTLAGGLTTLHSFNSSDGSYPRGGVMQATDGNLYGDTDEGGVYNLGTVFKITTAGTLTTLHSFNSTDGTYPLGGVMQATDGNLYGTTFGGGTAGVGTIFKITTAGTLNTLHSFNTTDGSNPYPALVQGSDGNLYGTTFGGGAYGGGTVFQLVVGLQPLTTLYSFGGTDDYSPTYSGLVQATDGNLYGGFGGGSPNYAGGIFKITTTGTLTTLYLFGETDGDTSLGGLIQATDLNLYGTTQGGGANSCGIGPGCGTVFRITLGGTLTTLHSFDEDDGFAPDAALVQAADGNFYGTTSSGGSGVCSSNRWLWGCGTVFKISPAGTLITLYNFCPQAGCSDGVSPVAGLVQGTNGNFYGVTSGGMTNGGQSYGFGTVFQITAAGKLTTLYSFCVQTNCPDGAYPEAGLLQANGNLYGTTSSGGAYGQGTVFQITPAGKLTTLHSFDMTDGSGPFAGLVQGTDGNFYGTTTIGGPVASACPQGCGTIFKMSPAGLLTTLHNFNSTDGNDPSVGLLQATDGNFYGTTNWGGAYLDGTIFKLSLGMGPFVKTFPTSAKVGNVIYILGTNLTGATSVSFNGKAATFSVISASEIKAKIPAGATTGPVTVMTPGSTLNSNAAFRVTPQILSFTPPSGAVGTVVTITGVSFTQTLAVFFNAVKATSFTVNSDTQVTATVPTGATTGKISISTPGGLAYSPTNFTVTTTE